MRTLPSLSIPVRSLQCRIPALFVVLVAVVLAAAFVLLQTSGAAATRMAASADVVAGARAFERLMELDTQRLIEGTRLLAADAAFREMVVAGDRTALGAALEKHGKRIDAALMLLVGEDQRVAAGTLEPEVGRRVAYTKLLDRATSAQQGVGIVPIGGQLYQLAAVPVPVPNRSPGSSPAFESMTR